MDLDVDTSLDVVVEDITVRIVLIFSPTSILTGVPSDFVCVFRKMVVLVEVTPVSLFCRWLHEVESATRERIERMTTTVTVLLVGGYAIYGGVRERERDRLKKNAKERETYV